MIKKLDKEHVEAIQMLQEKFAQNAKMLGAIAIELEMISQQQKILTDNQVALFWIWRSWWSWRRRIGNNNCFLNI